MSTPGQQGMLAEGRRMRSLAGQSLIYGMSGVIGRFAGFFLIPIYLHAAGAKAYGTVDLMLSAVLLASILLRMGIVTTMSRFTLGEGETDWAPIIHTIFVFVMTAATLGVLVGWVFRGFIGHVLQVDTDIVLAGLFGLWISMNYDVMARVYRIERRARAWVRFTLLNILLTTILTLLLGGRLRPGGTRPADRKLHRHRAGLPDRGDRPPPHDRHSPLRPAGAARPAHLLAAADAGQHRALGAEPGRPHPGAAAGRSSGAGHLLGGGASGGAGAGADGRLPDGVGAVRPRRPRPGGRRAGQAHLRFGADVLVGRDGLGAGRDQPDGAALHRLLPAQEHPGGDAGGDAAGRGHGALRRLPDREHRRHHQPPHPHDAADRLRRGRRQPGPELLGDPALGHRRRRPDDGARVCAAAMDGLGQLTAQLPGPVRVAAGGKGGGGWRCCCWRCRSG